MIASTLHGGDVHVASTGFHIYICAVRLKTVGRQGSRCDNFVKRTW